MNYITYKLIPTDTFNSGPSLDIEPWEDYENNDEDEYYYRLDIEFTSDYIVYHTLLGYESHDHIELKPIAKFQTHKEAQTFAKIQYYLYTGDYPFIVDGITSGYKSTGSRKEIRIDKDVPCLLVKPKNINMLEYIIISNGLTVESHSLNEFAEW